MEQWDKESAGGLTRGLIALGIAAAAVALAVGSGAITPGPGAVAAMLFGLGAMIVVLAMLVRRERSIARRHLARAEAAERVRRTSEARLLDALNSMTDALLLCGPDDRYLISNIRYQEIMGPGAPELRPGMSFDTLMRDVLERGIIDTMGETAEAWGRRRREMRARGRGRFEMRMADGRWLMVRESPTHDGGLLSLYSDVTAIKAREAALAAARDAAERANKVKTDFLANVSHELRTPLNAVIGFTDMLLMGYAGPVSDRQREYLGDIRDSATHLLSVINDILDLSRAEAAALPLDPRPLDLARLLRSTVRMLQPKADQGGLTLSLDVDPPALPAVVDEVRIRQVIVNLLSNAIKFTEPGGWVTITARRTVDAGQEERGAGWIRIEIADDGIGMPPGEIERAFEPFVQLDAGFSRRFEGTGLGLPLARRLVEAHGGRLNLFSEPGEGTQAVILLRLPAEGGRDED